jgi:hypothetical protein
MFPTVHRVGDADCAARRLQARGCAFEALDTVI